jgi:hypothetical protein
MQELIRIIDHASPKMWSLIRQTLKDAIDRELKTMSDLMEEVPIQKTKLTAPHAHVSAYYCVSAYYYICVLILLYIEVGHKLSGPDAHICIRILLYVCPHTTVYVSAYTNYIGGAHSIRILLYVCPHTTVYVSAYTNRWGTSCAGRMRIRSVTHSASSLTTWCSTSILRLHILTS